MQKQQCQNVQKVNYLEFKNYPVQPRGRSSAGAVCKKGTLYEF